MAFVISGRVVDTVGRPVSGASVMIGAAPVAVADIAQITATTGEFGLAAPASGTYRIVANADGWRAVEIEVEVGDLADATASLEIVLEDSDPTG